MLGRAAIAMWWDPAPGMQAEIEDWHSHEHFPERLGIPGFLRGSRWISESGATSYFIIYEVKNFKTMTSGPYMERLNNPTEWSRRMMPHHLNMARSLCRVRAKSGGGHAFAMATVRFSPRRGASVTRWLVEEFLPGIPKRKGLTGAHLLQSTRMPAEQTTEQKIRGGDAAADMVLLLNGYDADAVRAVVENDLSAAALAERGARPGAMAGVYRLSYSATAKDFA